jgi:uncharacterized membrane protein YtjA (UPF0391 family)
MLSWVIIFFVFSVIAAIFGFGEISGVSSSVAQVLFFVFLILFFISLFFRGRKNRGGIS